MNKFHKRKALVVLGLQIFLVACALIAALKFDNMPVMYALFFAALSASPLIGEGVGPFVRNAKSLDGTRRGVSKLQLVGILLLGAAVTWSIFSWKVIAFDELPGGILLYLGVTLATATLGISLMCISEISRWKEFLSRWRHRE